jgi:uncharacterized protein
MRLKLIPQEGEFVELFEQLAEKVALGASELLRLLQDFQEVEIRVGRIVDIEHEGDELTHEIIRRINVTFITPFDRSDIHLLASGLDDVLDHIQAAAEYLQLHRIDEPLPQMITMAETLATAARLTADAMPQLKKLKGLEEYWIEINRLENEGDGLYRRTIAELFSGDHKAMDVLKWKDIVEEIEQGIDASEDVANTVESIVLKQG